MREREREREREAKNRNESRETQLASSMNGTLKCMNELSAHRARSRQIEESH
jgi:hypothetical protein